MAGPRTLLSARWVLGHRAGRHCLIANGEVVVQDGKIVFAGHRFPGTVDARHDYGHALICPGFIDLDALSDLDTTILGFDNQPAWKKGRVWPHSYTPYEMYAPEELAFQKRHAFAQLLRNGITTALPIASLFYREWGETVAEFTAAAEAASDLGLRVYLGPAYRTGNQVVDDTGVISAFFDEDRGFQGLDHAIDFCRVHEGTRGGLVRTMLSPDRVETCTPELLRRTAAAVRELDVPVRLHCCQSRIEYEMVLARHGMSPPEWLASLGFLSPRALLPHATWVSGSAGVAHVAPDLEIMRDAGASIVHCPLVSARGGRALNSFRRYREMGLRLGMGTDTAPPDMILNMQAGLLLSRVMEGDAASTRAEHMLDAATVAGADALGRPDLGRIMAGAAADMIVIDFNHPQVGQVIDPVQTLLLTCSGRDVRDVMVAGRFVLRDFTIPGEDAAAGKARAQAQFDGMVARYPERTLGHPPLEEIFSSAYPMLPRGEALA